MNRVENYIKELLYTNDCVIVPEFGGFVTSYNSSEVHPIRHHFTPPSKRVAFNEKLKLNDGLLISYISNEANISLKESTDLVSNFVSEITNGIKVKGKFIFDEVGELFKNVEGRLQFKNIVKSNFLEDSFGLPDFFAEPISRESNIKLKNKFKDRKAMSTEEIKKDEKEGKKKTGGASIWILSIVAILLCCSAVFLFVIDKNENSTLSSMLPSDWFSSNEVSSIDSLSEEVETENASDSTYSEEEDIYDESSDSESEEESESYDESSFEESTNDENVSNTTEESSHANYSSGESFLTSLTGRYYVISGAFSEQSNAEKLRDELIAKGFDAKVLSPLGRKPLFRVSIADFEDQQSGLDKASADNVDFDNSLWVMKY